MEQARSKAAGLLPGPVVRSVPLLKLGGLVSSFFGAAESEGAAPKAERRKESRRDFLGRKVILRQYRSLGIMHLRNLSRGGACGLTDMPLEIGSIVFVEVNRPHFYAAEVVWTSNLRIGLSLFKPLKPEMLERLHAEYQARTKAD